MPTTVRRPCDWAERGEPPPKLRETTLRRSEECTIKVPRAKTKVGTLWATWKTWCDYSGDRPGRQQDFTAALEDHGLEVEEYQHAKYALGLGLREVGEAS
jgi:hypothetical protein